MSAFAKYTILTALLIATAFVVYVLSKTSYSGNDKIIFLHPGSTYTSFNNIIQRPEFKNKVVYVDVWGTNCPSCFEEFKNYTPQLTAHYSQANDIAFLYICIDRHPLPAVRWKEKIQLYKPNGYHILIGADEEFKLAMDVIGEAAEGQFFPYQPCYFIVDKKGSIVYKPTLDPDKGEFKPSDTILLYNKLDSLRQL